MCWSIEISLLSAACHLTTLWIVTLSLLPRSIRRGFQLFLGFYTIMEVFQALQWATLDIQNTTNSCDSRNSKMTIIAYMLIWIQPVLFSFLSPSPSRKRQLSCIITFLYALVSLYRGMNRTITHVVPRSNYGPSTCTYLGEHGHLDWKFAVFPLIYHPTHYVYLLLISIEIAHFPRVFQYTIGAGWFLTLVLSSLLVGGGPEIPAFWCMTSMFADIPIIICSFFYTRKRV